jgi:hypothetical protein
MSQYISKMTLKKQIAWSLVIAAVSLVGLLWYQQYRYAAHMQDFYDSAKNAPPGMSIVVPPPIVLGFPLPIPDGDLHFVFMGLDWLLIGLGVLMVIQVLKFLQKVLRRRYV